MDALLPVLFYDSDCGPCTLLARAFLALGRGRLEIAGLASGLADESLRDLGQEARYSSMHLAHGTSRYSAGDAVLPLLGVVFGRSALTGLQALPPVARSLVWLHSRLSAAKRASRCGVGSAPRDETLRG